MAYEPTTDGVSRTSSEDYNRARLLTGTSEEETVPVGMLSVPKISQYRLNKTLDTGKEIQPEPYGPVIDYKKAANGGLDKSLLKRAGSIVENFNVSGVMDAAIDLESLRGVLLQLWQSATDSTQFHQEILTILESAVISVESPTPTQLSAFREAIIDLGRDVLAQVHIDVIRRRFISEGFSPLALLSEIKNGDSSSQ